MVVPEYISKLKSQNVLKIIIINERLLEFSLKKRWCRGEMNVVYKSQHLKRTFKKATTEMLHFSAYKERSKAH